MRRPSAKNLKKFDCFCEASRGWGFAVAPLGAKIAVMAKDALSKRCIGAALFDPATRLIVRGQEERKISPKAAAVLLALGETAGQVWSRDALLERIWPGVHVGEEVLTHAIGELRRAFGDNARAPRFVQTVHKSGYRLMLPLENAGKAPAGAANGAASSAITLRAFADYLAARDLFERGGRQNTLTAIDLRMRNSENCSRSWRFITSRIEAIWNWRRNTAPPRIAFAPDWRRPAPPKD
jgi:DNA-binding winged helix-turn-helix (wHTH) protein